MKKESLINEAVDHTVSWPLKLIYSKEKKYVRYLILLMIIGFILRLIAALNQDVLADDMVYASQSAGIIRAGILSTHSNPPLFFYLTDFFYSLMGYTTLASRFIPLIAGVMIIPLVFLITRRFFSERVALGAAFFATFSNFLVRTTFTEQTLVVLFLSFAGVYFGIKYLDNRKYRWLILSGVGFGLALLTKYNAPFFILSFLLFALIYTKSKSEKLFSRENKKHLFVFIIILLIFAMPFLAFNWFIYKDKGIVDVYFSRIIHVDKAQQVYGGLAGQGNSFFSNVMTLSNYGNYILLYETDLLILIFGLIGLWFIFKEKENKLFKWFFLIFLLIPFVLQSAGAPLQKHFTFMPFLFAIPAGYALDKLFSKINKKSINIAIVLALAALMIINLGHANGTPNHYLTPSATSSLKSFINTNTNNNDLLVFDNRIYTSRTFWLATDRPFITIDQFADFFTFNKNLTNSVKQQTSVYFIQCNSGDCGWGWVSTKPDFNQTTESMFDSLKKSYSPIQNITEYTYDSNEFLSKGTLTSQYTIYKVNMELDQNLVQQTKLVQSFYFVPYLYLNMNNYLFNYSTGGIDSIINSLSSWVIYLSMALAAIFVIIILLML